MRLDKFLQSAICIILILALSGCSGAVDKTDLPPESVSDLERSDAEHETEPQFMRTLFFERNSFLSATMSPNKYESNGKLIGGIVPHHLLASDMIAGFFSMASDQSENFDTVLLISTSHFPENTGSLVVTSTLDWKTPYGNVKNNREISQEFIENSAIDAENNWQAVEADHGVAGLVPFVKYYLPDADIATLMIANNLDRFKLDSLSDEIAQICENKRVLLVASIDFSHYLFPDQAAVKDVETVAAIDAMDMGKIVGFGDGNLDSPQTMGVFLKLLQKSGGKIDQLDHSTSPDKLPYEITNPIFSEGITTYFVYAIWEE